MLSDEDKEIFNNLKEYMQDSIDKGYHKFIYNDLDWDFKCIDCINAIDKVLKQSKEIEELKNEVMEKELIIDGMKEDRRIAVEEIQEQYYVSNDKIKAKIEELKKERSKLNFESDCMLIDDIDNKIEALESLLEKE